MKKGHLFLSVFLLTFLMTRSVAQNVAINATGALPDSNAMLDVSATNKGILIPRMNSAVRLSIPATKGLLVYDTTTNSFWYHTGTVWQNMATASGAWSLNGNSATDSNSFIGTTDGKPFNVRIARYLSGHIDFTTHNCSWGFLAGNTNVTGWQNTAIGNYSLYANTTGSANVTNGFSSLTANTTGSYNTAVGMQSLKNNIIGVFNTGIGADALYNNTGSRNTAIGALADVDTSQKITNSTAIGYDAFVNTSNKVRIGNGAVTVIEGQVPFTTPSDGRFKFNIQEDVKGLSFITQLRPVTYQFDVKRFYAQQQHKDVASDDVQWATYDEAMMVRRTGFIAQEVEKAAINCGFNFSGIIKPKAETEHYGLSYESFVVPLVKAVQELNIKLEQQNDKLADLQHQLDALKQSLSNAKQ